MPGHGSDGYQRGRVAELINHLPSHPGACTIDMEIALNVYSGRRQELVPWHLDTISVFPEALSVSSLGRTQFWGSCLSSVFTRLYDVPSVCSPIQLAIDSALAFGTLRIDFQFPCRLRSMPTSRSFCVDLLDHAYQPLDQQ